MRSAASLILVNMTSLIVLAAASSSCAPSTPAAQPTTVSSATPAASPTRRPTPTATGTATAVPGFEEVPGVGDHAMIGAFGHAFYVQRGDAVITMSMMMVPDARVKGSEIGKRIIGKL